MRKGARAIMLLLAAGLMLLTAGAAHLAREVAPQKLRQPLSSLAPQVGPWRMTGQDQVLDQGTLDNLKPQDYLLRNYLGPDGRPNTLFIAYFGMQQEGRIIHSPRQCLPGSGWEISQKQTLELAGSPGQPWPVNYLIMTHNLDLLSVLYWFQGRGRVEASEYWSRFRLVVDGITLDRNDGALVRLTTVLPEGRGHDRQKVLQEQMDLAGRLIPMLETMFPPPGPARQ